jgi:alpha-glucosidase
VNAAEESIELYATLIALRRDHVALSEGGIRWLHAGDDVLVFVREHPDESVLVAAARGDFGVALDRHAFVGEASAIFGDATLRGTRLSGKGPSFSAWRLPGVPLPQFAEPGTVLELEPHEVMVE